MTIWRWSPLAYVVAERLGILAARDRHRSERTQMDDRADGRARTEGRPGDAERPAAVAVRVGALLHAGLRRRRHAAAGTGLHVPAAGDNGIRAAAARGGRRTRRSLAAGVPGAPGRRVTTWPMAPAGARRSRCASVRTRPESARLPSTTSRRRPRRHS